MQASHDQYAASLGECRCARCLAAYRRNHHIPEPDPDELEEPELDEAAAWGGIDL